MSIYRICLPDTDDTYIGSTHDLRQRLSVHKHKSRTMDTKLYTALGKYDYGQWRVEVLEELDGSTRRERAERERHYIEELKPTLNTRIPCRTQLEYYYDKKRLV